MTIFWQSFMQEPDSIVTTALRAHLREVLMPVGEAPPSIVMVDIAALAAQYPSVAADLKKAGLTAAQHEAYRVALASAVFLHATLDETNPLNFPPDLLPTLTNI